MQVGERGRGQPQQAETTHHAQLPWAGGGWSFLCPMSQGWPMLRLGLSTEPPAVGAGSGCCRRGACLHPYFFRTRADRHAMPCRATPRWKQEQVLPLAYGFICWQ